MKARSSAQARLMEAWAHGQDVADALGGAIPRFRPDLSRGGVGIKTFSWSFRNRELQVPAERVRVALRGSSGRTFVWNDHGQDCVNRAASGLLPGGYPAPTR